MRESLILILIYIFRHYGKWARNHKGGNRRRKMEKHLETSEDCEKEKKIEEDINELDSLSENSDEINKNKCEAFVREIREEFRENPVSKTKEECQVFINEERQVFINEERLEAVVPSPRAAMACSAEEDPLLR